ncbi:hypothetical protein [Acetobacter conturbans]|uniref:Uncharacterized protein n=1 Tax=Acetobacter conturbans TaxID=1737472 RepID=A0ABX0JXV7_9PROT|nr:hypothetical protein [Acetobacter conturbans]NHN87825.1 hypothetical protein [Acetobacter conturbans]
MMRVKRTTPACHPDFSNTLDRRGMVCLCLRGRFSNALAATGSGPFMPLTG